MDKFEFKYASQLAEIAGCPPDDYRQISRPAFRFVQADLGHPDNFRPVSTINPQRSFPNSAMKCKAFGLSLFPENEAAIAFFKHRILRRGLAERNIGSHLASFQIEPEDGVASRPEPLNFDHFTFHEYLRADFAAKIINVQPLSINL